jgi:hypothetical protein
MRDQSTGPLNPALFPTERENPCSAFSAFKALIGPGACAQTLGRRDGIESPSFQRTGDSCSLSPWKRVRVRGSAMVQ